MNVFFFVWGGGESENECFGGYDEIVVICGASHKTGLFGGSFLYILGLFLNVRVQNWNIFLGGLLNFFFFFQKNLAPPPPLHGPHLLI